MLADTGRTTPTVATDAAALSSSSIPNGPSAPKAVHSKTLQTLSKAERRRQHKRTLELARFSHTFRTSLPVYITAFDPLYLGPHGQWEAPRPITFKSPFFEIVAFFLLPVFKEMAERNVEPQVIREELVQRREEMFAMWTTWRNGLEEEFVKRVLDKREAMEGELEQRLANVRASGDQLLPDITVSATLVPVAPSSPRFPHQEALSQYSANARLLLRADSIFRDSKSSATWYYPGDMEIMEMSWAYPGPWKSGDQDAERAKEQSSSGSDRSVGDIEYNVPAAMIAQRLLKELGRPDALYIEMLAVGERFLCGRCDEFMCPVEWPVLVDHYLTEHETWEQKLKDHPNLTSHPSIEYRNLHDFSDYDKPTVVLVSRVEQKRLSRQNGHQVGKMMRCKLCKQLGLSYTSTKKTHLEFHVRNVHGVID